MPQPLNREQMLQNRGLPRGTFSGDSSFWRTSASEEATEAEPVAKFSLYGQLAPFVAQGMSTAWS